ncbi:MAG: EF-hand domain-containing protein [Campylobacterota bacterium]|nr:EF-hand domain-containing protein [Campylobacterota bacterium]
MKKLTKSIIAITVLGTLAYAVPTAQQKFKKADSNNDGVLSSSEFYNDQARKMDIKIKEGKALKGATTAPQFDMVDKNKDGKITFKEFDKFHTKRQKDMVDIKNKGGDYSQGNGKGAESFNRYDRNKDGCVDKNEFRKLYIDMKGNSSKGQGNGR